MAEGVGFEPTVGFPTLDFESSALNRTQPPFPNAKENVEHRTSNIQFRMQVTQTILSAQAKALKLFRQNCPSAASYLKSQLHRVCSTQACSLRLCPMDMPSRSVVFLSLIITTLFSSTTIDAQGLPNTTRLLRFPTTNDREIVFCYAGELYTVGTDGGVARG